MTLEDRLAELEGKLCFAEDAVEALSSTVYRQQRQIDVLGEELRALRRQVAASQPEDVRGPGDEIPPHY